ILGIVLIIFSIVTMCFLYIPGVLISVIVFTISDHFTSDICKTLQDEYSQCTTVISCEDGSDQNNLSSCLHEVFENIKISTHDHIYMAMILAASIGTALT
ncbi:MAG: hypothetical protein MHPSP_003971, partial [Paramarteilia canceri]